MHLIDRDTHLDETGGAPLVCRTCGGTQAIEQTETDPLMWIDGSFTSEEIVCDACHEASQGWAQECAVSAWENSQR